MVFRFKPEHKFIDLRLNQIWGDFHVHSRFSPDAHHSIDAICRRALALGLEAVAITDHVEWRRRGLGNEDLEGYFEDIQRAKCKYQPLGLHVLSGVEVGNPHDYPRKYSALLSLYPFDVVIASLHWLGEDNIHDDTLFDGKNPDQVYQRYFQEMAGMIQVCDFDILAHPDRIFGTGLRLETPPDLLKLAPWMRRAASSLAQKESLLELNTKYFSQYPDWGKTAAVFLNYFQDAGGSGLVINSDAHTPAEMTRSFQGAQLLLNKLGFNRAGHFLPSTVGALLL